MMISILPALLTVAALLPAAAAAGPPAGFAMHDAPQELPPITFQDEAGQTLSLEDWRGKYVLLNIWATWCLPCREEMPTLDNLHAALGSERFEVLALSIDRAGVEAVRRFYDEIGVVTLRLVIDESGRAASDLGVIGLPATILIDPDGRELGRLLGPAEWDAPDMSAFILNIISPWKERRQGDDNVGRQ
jgi:thiol-disulfide isomerase/thioredoxin